MNVIGKTSGGRALIEVTDAETASIFDLVIGRAMQDCKISPSPRNDSMAHLGWWKWTEATKGCFTALSMLVAFIGVLPGVSAPPTLQQRSQERASRKPAKPKKSSSR